MKLDSTELGMEMIIVNSSKDTEGKSISLKI